MKYTLLCSSLVLLFSVIPAIFQPVEAYAHCQIPCGIYGDHDRVKAMLEDVDTIEKSVKLITELAGKTDVQSLNQQVRWVMNKEQHAEKIISTISDYFLTQRVKLSQADYSDRLKKHHAVILLAMEAKQKADLEVVKKLRKAVGDLAVWYPAED